jgi:hypothetical protein
MKRVMLMALLLLTGALCLLSVAGIAWTTWVLATGGGWLLAFTFDCSQAGAFVLLYSIFGLLASLSLWGTRRVFRRMI